MDFTTEPRNLFLVHRSMDEYPSVHREGASLSQDAAAFLNRECAMHAAIASSPKGPIFYWNVDSAVGRNGVNKFDDVLFVQWCFYKLGKWQGHGFGAELRATVGRVAVNGECNGRDDDLLVESIKALQREFGLMVDGRVSPVTTGAGTYTSGGGRSPFLIIYPLNAILQQMYPAQYPRIDLMPEFVWRIKESATAPFNW